MEELCENYPGDWLKLRIPGASPSPEIWFSKSGVNISGMFVIMPPIGSYLSYPYPWGVVSHKEPVIVHVTSFTAGTSANVTQAEI